MLRKANQKLYGMQQKTSYLLLKLVISYDLEALDLVHNALRAWKKKRNRCLWTVMECAYLLDRHIIE